MIGRKHESLAVIFDLSIVCLSVSFEVMYESFVCKVQVAVSSCV